jgi:hypothetical protein
MRSTGQLLDAAVANNASWCAAVCRAHGHQSARGRRLWASLWPGLPVVGYQHGTALHAARRAGFDAIGDLRIWLRPA